MEKIRNISDLELMICDMQELYNSSSFHFLIEFIGDITVEEIENTINNVIVNTPGINVYKNKKNWINKKEFISVKSINYEGEINLINDDFFREMVDFNERSIALYLLNMKNKKSRYLVFKFFHGVFDGKGALLVIENFINTICNKNVNILINDITDVEFLGKIKHYNKKIFLNANYRLKNENEITKTNEYKMMWNVITLDKYVQNITAKIINILQHYYVNNNVKYMIPVDLRSYDRNNKRIGNLIVPLYLDVSKNDNVNEIAGNLLLTLKEKNELNISNIKGFGFLLLFPDKIRRLLIKFGLSLLLYKNKYYFGGMVSHLGRVSFNDCSKINIENIISLSNHSPLTPLSISIVECKNKTNIAVCSYENRFPKEVLENIINEIKELE